MKYWSFTFVAFMPVRYYYLEFTIKSYDISFSDSHSNDIIGKSISNISRLIVIITIFYRLGNLT